MVVAVQLYHICRVGCRVGDLDDCDCAGVEYDEYDDAELVGDGGGDEHDG